MGLSNVLALQQVLGQSLGRRLLTVPLEAVYLQVIPSEDWQIWQLEGEMLLVIV